MAHNGGTPRLLAKCGSAVEVLDKQQIEDPALARVKRARTTGQRDSLPSMAPHSSRHLRASRPGDAYARSRTLNHLWGHRKLEPNNPVTPGPLKVDITRACERVPVFSNRLGCLGSILVSVVLTLILVAVFRVL